MCLSIGQIVHPNLRSHTLSVFGIGTEVLDWISTHEKVSRSALPGKDAQTHAG